MTESLQDIARRLVAPGKGILAADESSSTIKKRFDGIALESTADTRRDYREMLFSADTAMREHISGVILFDETIRQSARDGRTLVELIQANGSIPGIKVDMGAKPLAFYPGETVTEGLDGLRERLVEYYKLGARFAKWRGRDHHRREPAYAGRAFRQCACAGPLCRALPGKRHRPDRRAGSPDGQSERHPHHRDLPKGHRGDARGRVRRTGKGPRRPDRHDPQAEHDRARQG